jgi:hypothetical protein
MGGGGGGGLISKATDAVGLTDSGAGDRALDAQQGAARKSDRFARKKYSESKKRLKPYLEGGQKSFSDLMNFNDNTQNFQDAQGHFQGHSGVFGMEDFEKDPGYDFRMQEGRKNIERSAAARGRMASSAGLKALAKFGQDYASNEYGNARNRFNEDYGNAYNRFNADNSNKFNRLNSLATYGMNAANSINGLASNLSNSYAATQAGLGNAAAANEMSRNQNGLGGLWSKGMQLGGMYMGSR